MNDTRQMLNERQFAADYQRLSVEIDAPDDLARHGLYEPFPGHPVAWSRHSPQIATLEPLPVEIGRCHCESRGERCCLAADGPDMRCTACRVAC